MSQRENKEHLAKEVRQAYISAINALFPECNLEEEADWSNILNAVHEARPKWNLPTVIDENDDIFEVQLASLRNLIRDEIESLKEEQKKISIARKKTPVEPLANNGLIKVAADRINKAAIEAFMPGAMKSIPEVQEMLSKLEARGLVEGSQFWAGYLIETKRDDLFGVVGFTRDPGEVIWTLLQKNGALAVKAQYALWARAYADANAEPNKFITISINQFCDDLGFKRKKRAHTRENKQAAMAVLEMLCSMQLAVIFRPPKGAPERLRGPLWSRGLIAERLDNYRDLFGANRVPGSQAIWEPTTFTYAPGPFFADETWRKSNHNVALIGEGLLRLNTDNKDRHAVMVGGYLAILARMNGYQQTRVRVKMLLEKTGLWAEAKNTPGRMREKLEKALDRLKEVEVIRYWEITSSQEEFDPDDLDSPETRQALAETTRWLGEWASKSVIIDWPEEMEKRASRLLERKIEASEKERKRKT